MLLTAIVQYSRGSIFDVNKTLQILKNSIGNNLMNTKRIWGARFGERSSPIT